MRGIVCRDCAPPCRDCRVPLDKVLVKSVDEYAQIERCNERTNSMLVATCLEQEQSKGYRSVNSEMYSKVNEKLGRVGEEMRSGGRNAE